MRKAILHRFILVLLVGLLVCGGISSFIINDKMVDQKQEDMLDSLRLMDSAMDYEGDLQAQLARQSALIMTGQNARITVVDFTGRVLADTGLEDPKSAQNHLSREEVEQAIRQGEGFAKRTSQSLGKTMLYTSLNSAQGDYVLRLSIPYNGVASYINVMLPSVLLGILVALAVSIVMANRFSKSVSQPLTQIAEGISNMQEDGSALGLDAYRYEELNVIVESTVRLSQKIERAVQKLRLERNKIQYILENMEEGLILLDEEENVLTINQSAKNFLHCVKEPRGNNIVHYTIQVDLLEAVTTAVEEGRDSLFDFTTREKRVISAHVSPTNAGVLHEHRGGVIVLLIDVTSDRRARKMRQDFFSNASHELKTPVTSIQGFADLLEAGVAKTEQARMDFIHRIQKEAQHMNSLITDILTISQLESEQPQEKERVRVDKIAGEVLDSLSPLMQSVEVTCKAQLSPADMLANSRQIRELLGNLVTNAVKYNRPQGTVTVTVFQKEALVYICVEDTGIGIPLESQGRIFERFYRVDKGRSKRMGGTGLGLAIVKHIVQFYHGTIHLLSRVEEGTKIEITLPADKE